MKAKRTRLYPFRVLHYFVVIDSQRSETRLADLPC
jgi:hypothetical protein